MCLHEPLEGEFRWLHGVAEVVRLLLHLCEYLLRHGEMVVVVILNIY